ncbi:MAG: DUF3099 domain-containing protein [Sporichthyaceae bacterium]
MRKKKAPPEVFRVTTTRPARSVDISHRYRRYALTMGIRTVCFLAAIVTTGAVRWTMFAAALLLPYMAVVVANGGREPSREEQMPVVLPSRTQLPPLPPGSGSTSS